jgi:hypothetical protein
VSTTAVLGGSAGDGVDRHQGWAQRPDGLRVHIHMRVHTTESGKGQPFRHSKRGVTGCGGSQRRPAAGPGIQAAQVDFCGNAPKSIFHDLRVPWLSGRFADVAADLAQ